MAPSPPAVRPSVPRPTPSLHQTDARAREKKTKKFEGSQRGDGGNRESQKQPNCQNPGATDRARRHVSATMIVPFPR
uniref:Uncharacterized protein n=1 Tax=Setaria viridis TaxID=4556 RepID=A0A4U6T4U4_SETVI|nr:hypothetical protein SEVIR_9G445933v2 [Setaria viridis]